MSSDHSICMMINIIVYVVLGSHFYNKDMMRRMATFIDEVTEEHIKRQQQREMEDKDMYDENSPLVRKL